MNKNKEISKKDLALWKKLAVFDGFDAESLYYDSCKTLWGTKNKSSVSCLESIQVPNYLNDEDAFDHLENRLFWQREKQESILEEAFERLYEK